MSTIGLDVGTSRVKAVRFDDGWAAVDVESERNVVRRGSNGRREQDMDDVWSIAARLLAAVVRRSPDRVDLVAITAQGDGCWLVDRAGDPVGPALLWNDSRAAGIVEQWQRDGVLADAFTRSGCLGAPGLAHAQLRWLHDHEPAVLNAAHTLLSCGSWIYAQLTGRRVLDTSDAANPFFDARAGRYDDKLLDLFGIGDLARLLPQVVSGADRVAPLKPDLVHSLGLEPGTQVALTPYDVPSTAIGTGVVDDGQAFAILGTTLCAGVVADDPRVDRRPNGMTLPTSIPGRWLIAYATMIGTEVLDWIAVLLGLPDAAGVSHLAATSRRDDLPLVLPYLSPAGERSPFLDSTIRGSIHGLDTSHTPADLARATFDGLSLVVKDCLVSAGTPATLALSGGGAASELWCRTICDAVGLPVVRPDVVEVGARGAVLSAATDAGRFDTIEQAIGAAVRPGQVYTPDPVRSARLERGYAQFLAARAHRA